MVTVYAAPTSFSMPQRPALDHENVPSFQWQDRLLVGHAAIDADHRCLFGYISEALDLRPGSAAFDSLFVAMVGDLCRHMAAEEEILRAMESEDLAEHCGAHRALAELARAALRIGREGKWGVALRLLSMPLLEHVAIEDRRMRLAPMRGSCS